VEWGKCCKVTLTTFTLFTPAAWRVGGCNAGLTHDDMIRGASQLFILLDLPQGRGYGARA